MSPAEPIPSRPPPGERARPDEPTADVLLVDDQPANLLALEAILAPLGQNLVTAGSGEEALRLLLHRDFAAVLLDVQMAGLDGFETARLIRGRQRSRHTPILFLTAHDDNRLSAEQAYTLGAVDYLVKPLSPVILRAKVAGFVELFKKNERLRRLERLEFERRLAEENARFRALTEHSSDAVCLIDPDGTVRYNSPAVSRVLGHPQNAYLGKSGFELVHPDDRARIAAALAELVRRPGGSVTTELRALHGDGSWRWVECVGTNLLAEPAVGAVVVNFRDITARKQGEEALRAAREQLQLVADTMPVHVARCSRDGRFVWVNRHNAARFGLTPEQVAGRHIAEVMGQPAWEAIQPYVARVLAGETVDYEAEMEYAGIGRRWMHVLYAPTRDAAGVPDGWVAVVTDVTQRKRAEEALREADRRKDEFLAMLAHELRNPLAPVRNAVQVLRLLGPRDPNLEWARDVIDRQVAHLSRLVDDLLDVARITQGKVRLRAERVDVAAVLARAVETARPSIEARGHELTVELPPGPLALAADPTRLAQVVANLLHNAAKYTEEGGRIRLSAAREGDEAVLRVRDSGVGITADVLPRIFEPFAQADRSLARSEGGLGIGLTLVRRLVELHGGTVAAASDGPGRGSEFIVRLPALADPPSTAAAPTPTAPRAAARSCRVLVVDDNADAADSLALLLRLAGHDVRTARDGAAALAEAAAFRPEVVFLDIGLPGMDGYEVARRLRRDPALGGALLVATTGYGQDDDRRRAREAGFDLHLVKPVEPRLVEEVLGAVG